MVQEVRKERSGAELTGITIDVFDGDSLYPNEECRCAGTDYLPFLHALITYSNPNMNQKACSDALDCMHAYYKVGSNLFHFTNTSLVGYSY